MRALLRAGVAAACAVQVSCRTPMSQERVMSAGQSGLSHYVSVLRRRWRWLGGSILLGAIIAAIASYSTTPLYRSTAQLTYVRQADVSSALGGTTLGLSTTEVQRESETYVTLMTTDEMKARAAQELGRELPSDLTIEAEYVPDTSVLRISAIYRDPEDAREIVNAYAEGFTRWRKQVAVAQYKQAEEIIRQKIAGYGDDPSRLQDPGYIQLVGRLQDIRVLEAAATGNFLIASLGTMPSEPFVPRHGRDILIGLLVGLVAGVGLVAVVEQLDVRFHRTDEVGEALALPVLARVPRAEGDAKTGLVTLRDPLGPIAEGYRIFRGNLDFADIDGHLRSLMVTSAVQGEGKSTTAANLAVAVALSGKRVVLVDADLRRASLHRLFGLKNTVGLSSLLTGRAALREALHPVELPGGDERDAGSPGSLVVLTSGPLPPNPGEIAASQRLAEVIASLAEEADLVIVDAPPFLVVGDAGALSRAVDGVVVVARLGTLTKAIAQESREFLATLPCRVLGVAVVGIPTESAAYRYRYYSKHADEAGDEAAAEEPTPAATA